MVIVPWYARQESNLRHPVPETGALSTELRAHIIYYYFTIFSDIIIYMLGTDMLGWWYSRGWKIFTAKLFDKLRDTIDFFSLTSLLKTLFAPFRQISAGKSGANVALGDRMRTFFDRLVSRIIGAIVRLLILIFGGLFVVLQFIFSIVLLVIWPILPFGIVVFGLMAMMGVKLW